jgi:hypothetical protein
MSNTTIGVLLTVVGAVLMLVGPAFSDVIWHLQNAGARRARRRHPDDRGLVDFLYFGWRPGRGWAVYRHAVTIVLGLFCVVMGLLALLGVKAG